MTERLTKEALTDRTSMIRIIPNQQCMASILQDGLKDVVAFSFFAYITVDPDKAWRTMDRGPSVEDEQGCKQYRYYWNWHEHHLLN